MYLESLVLNFALNEGNYNYDINVFGPGKFLLETPQIQFYQLYYIRRALSDYKVYLYIEICNHILGRYIPLFYINKQV